MCVEILRQVTQQANTKSYLIYINFYPEDLNANLIDEQWQMKNKTLDDCKDVFSDSLDVFPACEGFKKKIGIELDRSSTLVTPCDYTV